MVEKRIDTTKMVERERGTLLSVEQVAQRLGRTVSAIHRYIREEDLPAYREESVGTGKLWIAEADLERWLDERWVTRRRW